MILSPYSREKGKGHAYQASSNFNIRSRVPSLSQCLESKPVECDRQWVLWVPSTPCATAAFFTMLARLTQSWTCTDFESYSSSEHKNTVLSSSGVWIMFTYAINWVTLCALLADPCVIFIPTSDSPMQATSYSSCGVGSTRNRAALQCTSVYSTKKPS